MVCEHPQFPCLHKLNDSPLRVFTGGGTFVITKVEDKSPEGGTNLTVYFKVQVQLFSSVNVL